MFLLQLRQAAREKQLEWTRKMDHLEVKNEHLRLEKEHFRKDAETAHKENSDLQIQLSAARSGRYTLCTVRTYLGRQHVFSTLSGCS